jgi:salicylate hydroxylase
MSFIDEPDPISPGHVLAGTSPRWPAEARALLSTPPVAWARWALYDCLPPRRWGEGPAALTANAANPSLLFLAEGGALAIEDAAALAASMAKAPTDPAAALRICRDPRQPGTARIVQQARRNGRVYHLAGPGALARNLLRKRIGRKPAREPRPDLSLGAAIADNGIREVR